MEIMNFGAKELIRPKLIGLQTTKIGVLTIGLPAVICSVISLIKQILYCNLEGANLNNTTHDIWWSLLEMYVALLGTHAST